MKKPRDRKVDSMTSKPTKPDMAGKSARGQGTGKKFAGGKAKSPGKSAARMPDKRSPPRS